MFIETFEARFIVLNSNLTLLHRGFLIQHTNLENDMTNVVYFLLNIPGIHFLHLFTMITNYLNNDYAFRSIVPIFTKCTSLLVIKMICFGT